jgi:mono/diheme cytochrome c family protein
MKHTSISRYFWAVGAFIVLTWIAGCAPKASTPAPATITPIPTFNFVPPTEAPEVATVAAQTALTATAASASSSLDPAKVERGKARYEALLCNTCHGDKGEGNGAKGPSLLTMKLDQDAFIQFLRSGGKMGSAHQYSANKITDSGAEALYIYILSLAAAK